eukprot:498007-Rhodomonas_salina.2
MRRMRQPLPDPSLPPRIKRVPAQSRALSPFAPPSPSGGPVRLLSRPVSPPLLFPLKPWMVRVDVVFTATVPVTVSRGRISIGKLPSNSTTPQKSRRPMPHDVTPHLCQRAGAETS